MSQSAVFDVAVIGGGPAGMMAAGRAAELGARVVLLEKNPILGKKLLISGGGRCNILNAEFDTHLLAERYGKKGKSLFSVFAQFDSRSTIDFFESRGLRIKVEAERRAFPVTDRAADVQQTMIRYIGEGGVKVMTGVTVKDIQTNSDERSITKIVHSSGSVEAKNYILATGGKSHPETGSTGDGFVWMKKLGHTVSDPDPALVPITIRNPWIRDAAGISLKDVRLTVTQHGKKHDSRVGKMLFTHTGLSGPLVLNMSKGIGALLKNGPVTVSLDLFPSLDLGALDKKLLTIFEDAKNKMIKNTIGELTQPRLGLVILTLAGIEGKTPLYRFTREERLEFTRLLKGIPMSVSGLLGVADAVVTGGGVSLTEIEFKTMRSKLWKNLSLVGDVLDFDRPSGGFSLQICWTTGFVAGTHAVE